MAKNFSFDIVSEVNLQTIDDVINITSKEIHTRFDLKTTKSTIEFDRHGKLVNIQAPSEFHINQIREILKQKMAKRSISSKTLSIKSTEKASGDMVRQVNEVVAGIQQDLAKKIVKDIKTLKIKAQASINEDKIRISAKAKDNLQEVIQFVKEKDYTIPLQFVNYR